VSQFSTCQRRVLPKIRMIQYPSVDISLILMRSMEFRLVPYSRFENKPKSVRTALHRLSHNSTSSIGFMLKAPALKRAGVNSPGWAKLTPGMILQISKPCKGASKNHSTESILESNLSPLSGLFLITAFPRDSLRSPRPTTTVFVVVGRSLLALQASKLKFISQY
jgi:hypothetical protein